MWRPGGKSRPRPSDPAIYPLCHVYAVGAENAEVYEEGGTNIWRQLAPNIAIAAVGLIFVMWAFGGYFIRMMHCDEPEATAGPGRHQGNAGAGRPQAHQHVRCAARGRCSVCRRSSDWDDRRAAVCGRNDAGEPDSASLYRSVRRPFGGHGRVGRRLGEHGRSVDL